jgi:dephospho-CoA kinase
VNKPLQIGITGGIGSGKSLVCQIFNKLGISVYDADSRAKSVMTTDGILVSQIKKEFGVLSYNNQGELNRGYLAEAVFNNPARLQVLNQLVHPRVRVDYENWLTHHTDEDYVLKEAALLYESESYSMLDKILVVFAPEDLRIARVLKRDLNRNEQQVREIIRNQMDDEEKRRRADFVIMNNESELVIPQVLSLHQQFISLAGAK